MRWLAPTERAFSHGREGCVFIIADVSGSIPIRTRMATSQAVKQLRRLIPAARAAAFHKGIKEITASEDLFNTYPESGAEDLCWSDTFKNTTDIGSALEYASVSKPGKTIIFSDGGCCNKTRTLDIARRMTGSIDCFFCEPSRELFDYCDDALYRKYVRDVDESFMRELARKGKGQLIRFQPNESTLTRQLIQSSNLISARQPMQDRYRVRPDTYHVGVPTPEHREIVRDVHLHYRTRYHHHHEAPEHVEHGAPAHAEIEVERTQGRVTFVESLKMIWQGADYQPPKREVDRGAITAAPAQQALPAPQRAIAQQPGVPALSAAQAFAKRK